MKFSNRFWLAVAILLYVLSSYEVATKGVSEQADVLNTVAIVGFTIGSVFLIVGSVMFLEKIIPRFNKLLDRLDE